MQSKEILESLGVDLSQYYGNDLKVHSPIDSKEIASLVFDSAENTDNKIDSITSSFEQWRNIPAPKRGELIRLLGEELRIHKEDLAQLVTIECGKIIEEGRGEVQEMIDICDFAVGLSRQLYGLTIASERENHTMQENWHPLGPIGIISAFNFPVAVWAWNFTLAIICGDTAIWKPSEKTPLTALACQAIFKKACEKYGDTPASLLEIVIGDKSLGKQIVGDSRLELISATGSSLMGQKVGTQVAKRFGKSLLELGGNNAIIVTKSADIDIALASILFGSVGTAGQRCTTTRRVFAHKDIYDDLFDKLKTAYKSIGEEKVGNPLDSNTLVGPLIDRQSFEEMQITLAEVDEQGGEVHFGERQMEGSLAEGYYVKPALVKMKSQTSIVCKETFAPILYVMPYEDLEQIMKLHNAVPQGLSSAIFTTDLREAEYFKKTSDCGIANVNIGTSGAEIGGAFGGEKETGGGRESGTDSWKNYMRRQTSTTYHGEDKPELAQGISFNTSNDS